MQNNELILLGKIIKVHGYNGAVMIALEGDFSEKVKEMESVFVEVDGKPVPFFFEWTKESAPDSIIIKFDYYDSDTGISGFVGCRVFTDSETITISYDNRLPLHLRGFLLFNAKGKEIGKIKKVVSFPMQIMLEVESFQDSELLIPYSEDWIIEIDEEKLTIILDIPQGLDSVNN